MHIRNLSALVPVLALSAGCGLGSEPPYDSLPDALGGEEQPSFPEQRGASPGAREAEAEPPPAPDALVERLSKGMISGNFGPAGDVKAEAVIVDKNRGSAFELANTESIHLTAPGAHDTDALIIFKMHDSVLEDLGGPGSRRAFTDTDPTLEAWICATEEGRMVFDEPWTAGEVEILAAGPELLEVRVTAVGPDAEAWFSFFYRPDPELLGSP